MRLSKATLKEYQSFVVPSYIKLPQEFVKGKGVYLWDPAGKKYLDFFSGWAVSNIGHCHPAVSQALAEQSRTLIHLPNNYYHVWQGELAHRIIRESFKGKVFFCNSGAEAVEGAIKLARFRGFPKKTQIITMKKSFHGRTAGAMAATAQAKYQKGIKPLLGGFRSIPLNDLDAFKKVLSDKTSAVMLELVQGEGGVNIADKDYVREVRKLCTQSGALMILDEVQTGMGRTGTMFSFQHFDIEPDVMLLAKGLGGGFPIGAIVVREPYADILQPGMHASTFGGSPIACRTSLAVFDAIRDEKLLANCQSMGRYLQQQLNLLKNQTSIIQEVRGLGLMFALDLNCQGKPISEYCLERGLIINVTQGNIIRLAPPLIIQKGQIDWAITLLREAMQSVSRSSSLH